MCGTGQICEAVYGLGSREVWFMDARAHERTNVLTTNRGRMCMRVCRGREEAHASVDYTDERALSAWNTCTHSDV